MERNEGLAVQPLSKDSIRCVRGPPSGAKPLLLEGALVQAPPLPTSATSLPNCRQSFTCQPCSRPLGPTPGSVPHPAHGS